MKPIDLFSPSSLTLNAKLRLRTFYKKYAGIPTNTREKRLFESLGVQSESAAYRVMGEMFNSQLPQVQTTCAPRKAISDEARLKKNKLARDKRAAKKNPPQPPVVYIAHLKLKIEYTKSFYESAEGVRHGVGTVVYKQISTAPDTALRADIPGIIENMNEDDGYKITTVEGYDIEVMDTGKLTSIPKTQQMMKRAYVLRNDWLRYAHGIAEYAYKNADGRCVYAQLTEFLLNPPSGNPTKFIGGRRVSEDAIFFFFKQFVNSYELHERYPDFTVDSGVSSELIRALCVETKRNMYAYDDRNKVFDSVSN